MKKLLFVFALLLFSASIFAKDGANINLIAVINPSTWGLDEAIRAVILSGLAYVIGLFQKKPKMGKKKVDKH